MLVNSAVAVAQSDMQTSQMRISPSPANHVGPCSASLE